MSSRLLSDAHPLLASLVREVMDEYARRFPPWCLVITSVHRTIAEQEALYSQGRVASRLELNAVRERAGMPPIYDDAEAHRIVTNVRNSKHNRTPSQAVDLAVAIDHDGPLGPLKPVIDWHTASRYESMGEIAKRHGLVWGGDWRQRDLCHVELPVNSAAQREET